MRLLYVDDEPDILAVVDAALALDEEIALTTACSGGEALERLAVEEFDAMVIDVMMPPPDGPATVRALRERGGRDGLVILFATAHTGAAERQALIDLGAAEILTKPFDTLGLGDIVRRVVAKARA